MWRSTYNVDILKLRCRVAVVPPDAEDFEIFA